MDRALVVSAVLLVVTLVGCSNETAPTETLEPSPSTAIESPSPTDAPTSAPNAGGPLCSAAQILGRLDERAQSTITGLLSEVGAAGNEQDAAEAFEASLGAIQEEMARLIPATTDVYDRLESAVPERLKKDVALVKKVSLELFDILSGLKSMKDFETIQQQLAAAGAAEAARATLRIDALTRERCGVGVAG